MTSSFLEGLDYLQEDTQVSYNLLTHCPWLTIDGDPLIQTHLNSNLLFNTEAGLLLFSLFYRYDHLYLCSQTWVHNDVFNPRPLSEQSL